MHGTPGMRRAINTDNNLQWFLRGSLSDHRRLEKNKLRKR
jgi:hypothetical protein